MAPLDGTAFTMAQFQYHADWPEQIKAHILILQTSYVMSRLESLFATMSFQTNKIHNDMPCEGAVGVAFAFAVEE